MLEFDGQPIDPAIVSAQPMKPAQNLDVSQMVCPTGMRINFLMLLDVEVRQC